MARRMLPLGDLRGEAVLLGNYSRRRKYRVASRATFAGAPSSDTVSIFVIGG